MREIQQLEIDSLQKRAQVLMRETCDLLGDNCDQVALEVRPGAGGEEAALFASELLAMYTTYMERKGVGVDIISGFGAEPTVLCIS